MNTLHGIEPRVRASYSLQHSPFFRQFLRDNATESRALKFRLGLTMEASRVTQFLNNHVPDAEFVPAFFQNKLLDNQILFFYHTYRRSIIHRKIKRVIRSSSKPMPIDYLLSNSSVLRRSAMEEYSRQKQDATKAISLFNRERWPILCSYIASIYIYT